MLLGQVDAVDICTPTDTHADIAVRAAAAGRHVICEKPLERTHAQGQRIIDACAEAGVHLFVAHVVRYFGEYATAQAAVAGGEIGSPAVLRLTRSGARPEWATWLHNEQRARDPAGFHDPRLRFRAVDRRRGDQRVRDCHRLRRSGQRNCGATPRKRHDQPHPGHVESAGRAVPGPPSTWPAAAAC